MGNHLRHDKECQNCGRTVEETYCPNCGQKNTETRQPFHHLFAHFVEDLTHYDGAFWKTIKFLLFRPARLTKQYLTGKRQSYVPPVKLYIFISFVTFLLPALLPFSDSEDEDGVIVVNTEQEITQPVVVPTMNATEDVYPQFMEFSTSHAYKIDNPLPYKTVREMDSIEALKAEQYRLQGFEYKLAKRVINLYSHNTPREVGEKFEYAFNSNIPKALFVYLPIFGFWLWLFHGKKRWYFFDHGIFTLHYFSFLLLTVSFITILTCLRGLLDYDFVNKVYALIIVVILIWQVYYFYRAHRKMYGEHWVINSLKSTMMFIINFVAVFSILVLFGLITLFNLH